MSANPDFLKTFHYDRFDWEGIRAAVRALPPSDPAEEQIRWFCQQRNVVFALLQSGLTAEQILEQFPRLDWTVDDIETMMADY